MPVHVRLFLVLFFCYFVQASPNNDLELKLRNLEKILLQRISNLEGVVTEQKQRISNLEGVVTEQKQRISNLEGVVTEQKNKIANLKHDVAVLQLQTNTNAKETSQLREILLRNRDIQLPKTKHTPSRESRRGPIKDRRLLLNTGGSGSRIAFYAYMSNSEPVQKHKTLIFDVIKSNFGHGYNNFTGIFTAPISGVYVLTFTIHPEGTAYASVQLVVNKEVEGVAFADSSSADDDITGVTAIVVVWMNQGDVSFARTHPTYASTGRLYSTVYGRCSFAGWLLSD